MQFTLANRSIRSNSIDEQISLNHPTSLLSVIQSQVVLIKSLQKTAQQQRLRRQQTQQDYLQYKQRGLSRQRQFYKILSRLDNHLQNKQITPTKQEVYITELYNKILCTFNAFNQKAKELLEDRYSELYRMMERRIDILMSKMDKELKKYRKMSEDQLKQMRDQIKEMAVIAADIQNQNNQLRTQNQSLTLKNKLLNQQKRLFLQQITYRKGLKVKQYNLNRIRNNQIRQQQLKIQSYQEIEPQINQNPEPKKHQKRRNLFTARNYRYDDTKKQLNSKTINISSMRQSSCAQNSINHLKLCLQRQKTRNVYLTKLTLQLQSKQSKIKQLFSEESILSKKQVIESTLLTQNNPKSALIKSSIIEPSKQQVLKALLIQIKRAIFLPLQSKVSAQKTNNIFFENFNSKDKFKKQPVKQDETLKTITNRQRHRTSRSSVNKMFADYMPKDIKTMEMDIKGMSKSFHIK